MTLLHKSIRELEKLLEQNEITATDLVNASCNRINELEDDIQAFLTLNEENAKQFAKERDASNDTRGALSGIPNGLKDNIVTQNLRTTAGSHMLANFDHTLYDAAVVKEIRDVSSMTHAKMSMSELRR